MNSNLLLLSLVLLGVSWLEWVIFGRKADAMLDRSPRVIWWVGLEIVICAVVGYGLYEVYQRKSWYDTLILLGPMVIGGCIGVGTSGLIDWKKYWRKR